MALTVTQRTRELGIRLALGADRSDVFRLVVGQGMLLVLIGFGIGTLGSFAAGRGLSTVLYGVNLWELKELAAAMCLLAAVALLACFLPARRATQLDPVEALRSE
jgi:putative ABC transport system permease protein